MIRSFLATDTVFTSNGEKIIQAIKCTEHREELDWYIDLTASLDYQDYLEHDMILVVETKEKGNQPFRIKNPRITSKVEVRAYHVGFDLLKYACELSTVTTANCTAAMTALLTNSEDTTPFSVYSDITTEKTFSVIDSNLYDGFIQIAEEYGGILDFDVWQIRITANIGTDRGVVLAYGKNIQESEVNENWDLVVTKLKPIGNDGIVLTPEWLTADVSYDRPYTKIMTFDTDDVSNLALVAQLYLDRYKVPRVNYKVKADVEQNVGLGDAVEVKARQFTTTAEVLSFDYNVLTGRVTAVEFGNFRPTLKNYFSELTQQAEERAVKKAQLKIDEVNGEIQAIADEFEIQIGERVPILTHNYVLNSDFASDFDNWTNNGSGTGTRTIETISDKKYFRLETTTTTNSFYGIRQDIMPYKHGQKITYSCTVRRNSGTGKFSFRVESFGDGFTAPVVINLIDATSEFIRYSFTFTSSSVTAKTFYRLFLLVENGTVAQFDITDIQFEVGEVLTDYVLNPSEIPDVKYIFTVEGANFYSDSFKIYNAFNVLKAYFDNVNDRLNLGGSVAMQKVVPTTITELTQFRNGLYGIKFGDDVDSEGYPYAYITAYDRSVLASLPDPLFGMSIKCDSNLDLEAEYVNIVKGSIRFPSTKIPSSNVNDLDDYEEGTWSPTLIGTTAAGTGTYTTRLGKYTKVGNKVSFVIQLAWTAHTGTGNLRISDLPFTSANDGMNTPCTITSINLTYSGQLACWVLPNTTVVELRSMATGGAGGAIAMDTAATIYIAGTYMV